MQFAVVNSSKSLDSRDVEFMVAACQAQAVEFCAAIGLDAPAAALYSDVSKLPVDDVWIVEITDSLDEPGALGYHSDVSNRPFIRVLAQGPQTSITLSHEFLELLGDPTCDRWAKRGDGTEVAVEVADPVEGDSYPVLAEVAGEGRTVEVSNYVLGSWFDPAGTAPFDRLGRLTAPFTMTPGGYMVVLDRGGNESEVFARVVHGGPRGTWNAGLKLAKVNGRLLRRLRASSAHRPGHGGQPMPGTGAASGEPPAAPPTPDHRSP
jgi:hypothetical protein